MRNQAVAILLAICLLMGAFGGCADADRSQQTMEPANTAPMTSGNSSETVTVPTEDTQPGTETTQPTVESSIEATQPPATEETQPSTTEETQPAEVFALLYESIRLTEPGQKVSLYQGSIDMGQIVWGSNNPEVAAFADGVLTAVGNGSTVVYAQYNNSQYTCEVYCQLINPEDRKPVVQPPSSVEIDSTFFEDAVFIGDSVTKKLMLYAPATGLLGNAQIIGEGSYGVGHAAKNTMLLSYRGQAMALEELLLASGAGKVFLMLGMNDLGRYGVDNSMGYWNTLIQKIRGKTPDIEIYIQSMTPVYTGGEKGTLNNRTVDAYNDRLQLFAAENNCFYIDVASYMKDATGGLAAQYCSDKFVHLSTTGANVWIQVLREYAKAQMERS